MINEKIVRAFTAITEIIQKNDLTENEERSVRDLLIQYISIRSRRMIE
jgi:hypothetical protein